MKTRRNQASNCRKNRFLLERLEDRLAPAFAAVGSEFRVNSFTTASQTQPRLASDADGDFVAVWTSNSQDGSGSGIYAQRYSSTGGVLGPEFRVNSYTTDAQFTPVVAMDSDGDFVIAWVSFLQDGASYGVYAQRYNSGGVALGNEFQVATTTISDQATPAVGMNAVGDFVISWASPDGNAYGVFARRYNAAGAPLTGEIAVNSSTTGAQFNPAVAVDAAGGFVITWQSSVGDGSSDGVLVRRFSSAGTPLTGEFLVNEFTTNTQNTPAIAMSLSGTSIIAWQSNGQDGSGRGVYFRRYFADGLPAGSETLVNITTTNQQSRAAIAMDASGNFAIAWDSNFQEGLATNYGIYARRYLANGTALGGEIHVNTFTTDIQSIPAIASDGDGDFVVAWQSGVQDGSAVGIYAQRYTDLDSNDDTANPFVAAVSASGSPSTIRPGDRLNGPITGLLIAFSEDVS